MADAANPPAPQAATAAPDVGHTPWRVALAGMAAMAIAMGVGRFAFTPLLPMMLDDGLLSIAEGSWLATANYVGYLLGALALTALPWVAPGIARRWHQAVLTWVGIALTIALTLGMALPWPALWPALRFLAGITAALILLNISGWCMVRLAALGHPSLASLIFCGPGIGIVLTGLPTSAMVAAGWQARSGWLSFGVLGLALCWLVWPVVRGRAALHAPMPAAAKTSAAPAATHARAAPVGMRVLHALAYGLSGLGYIVTATFLPVIARGALPPGSLWVDLFWPIFGLGSAMGAALASRLPMAWDRRWLLMWAFLMQGLGIAVCLLWSTAAGFALSSALVGLPFTVITFLGLQEARRQWPAAADSFASLVTAIYGLGQIAGPPLVAWLLAHTAEGQGFAWGLGIAAGALALGAVMNAASAWRWPLRSGW